MSISIHRYLILMDVYVYCIFHLFGMILNHITTLHVSAHLLG